MLGFVVWHFPWCHVPTPEAPLGEWTIWGRAISSEASGQAAVMPEGAWALTQSQDSLPSI